MGKTSKAQRYTISDPDAEATKGQTFALYSITGVDVRGLGLTKGQASELIDVAKSGRARHTRVSLVDAGGEVKTRDVHKNFRDDPKPRGYKLAKVAAKGNGKATAKGNGDDDDAVEQLAKLIRKFPELGALLSAQEEAEEAAEEKASESKEEPVVEPKPKASSKPKPKAAGKGTQSKKDKTPAKASSDDDLLTRLATAIESQGE